MAKTDPKTSLLCRILIARVELVFCGSALLLQWRGVPATTRTFISLVNFSTNLSSMKCNDPSSGLNDIPAKCINSFVKNCPTKLQTKVTLNSELGYQLATEVAPDSQALHQHKEPATNDCDVHDVPPKCG